MAVPQIPAKAGESWEKVRAHQDGFQAHGGAACRPTGIRGVSGGRNSQGLCMLQDRRTEPQKGDGDTAWRKIAQPRKKVPLQDPRTAEMGQAARK
ncbi:hypothetical protein FKM82_029289 [Ascaphus truei]